MLLTLLISTIFCYIPFVYSANVISATGGGVVAKGHDLILNYTVGKDDEGWTTCKWGRYEPSEDGTETNFEYCMWLDQTGNGTVSLLTCKPKNFNEANQIEYVGTSKSECSIKVGNVSMDDSVSWAAALGSDVTPKKINVTVAMPLDNATQVMNPEPAEVGVESVVTCTVIGGEPIPEITIISGAMSDNSNLTINNSSRTQLTTKLENGKSKTVYNVTIVPQVNDHGRTIDCVAIQYDKAEPKQILFKESQGSNGSLNANQLTLNVQYPPQQGKENKTYPIVKGSDASISVMINANPKPTNIMWFVRNSSEASGNQTDSWNENSTSVDISLPSSESRSRYTVPELMDTDEPTMFLAKLNISNVSNSDHLMNHYLMVKNDKGQQTYYFYINVTDYTPPPTTPDPTTPSPGENSTQSTPSGDKGSNGAVTAIVVIVVLAILIVGGVIFYKKYYLNRQTVPHYNLR